MNAGVSQADLFGNNCDAPQGLRLSEAFVTPELESDLISKIAGVSLSPFEFGPFTGKRRVAFFGSRYNFSSQALEPAEPLPGWLGELAGAIERSERLPTGAIVHALITEYPPGAGIGWHRDKPQFRDVYGLSLGSPCLLRFRRREGGKWRRYNMMAAPRSLYVLSGEVRTIWEHSISSVPELRYSITFRTMR